MSMTYMGVDAANKWGRIATYGPKLVENATQAIARDILCEAMWRMERKGLCIVAHVHDEVIIEAPKGQYSVEEICDIMNERPEWGQDIPLSSAGYTGEHYLKD
jgi:DNA polymerase